LSGWRVKVRYIKKVKKEGSRNDPTLSFGIGKQDSKMFFLPSCSIVVFSA
jgi:hypothetical protein